MDWREWDAPRAVRARQVSIGLVCQAVAAWKWWLIGLPLAALVLVSTLLSLQPTRYSAEAQVVTGPRHGGMIGLRAAAAVPDGALGLGAAIGQARLIASRDLARRVIRDLELPDSLEFDPAAGRFGFVSRALVSLGIKRDPARESPEDRILEAFQERLRVSGPDKSGLVSIAFQSENPELAASAANRTAELYLDMRASAGQAMPHRAAARILSRARAPAHPLPGDGMLLVTGTAIAVIAFGAFVAIVLPRFPLQGRWDEPVVQPRPIGESNAAARIKVNERLNPGIAPRSVPPPPKATETAGMDQVDGQAMAKAAARLLLLRTQAPRGIRIVAACSGAICPPSNLLLELARELARGGRSIAINLDAFGLFDSGRAASSVARGHMMARAEPALGDLIAGTASFSEVIRRDPASRLHLLPVGRSGELDLNELGNVLDSLAETYDFIVMVAPPADQDDMTKILAAKADFAVLVVPAGAGGAVFAAERQLIETGVPEVMLIDVETDAGRGLGRDAA
ncbi:MAG: hypothetical protein L0Y50_12650 [Beijerinckiaceae bacterium]|nr:hypothetical protein [Beijerinckiaceae bacterium]